MGWTTAMIVKVGKAGGLLGGVLCWCFVSGCSSCQSGEEVTRVRSAAVSLELPRPAQPEPPPVVAKAPPVPAKPPVEVPVERPAPAPVREEPPEELLSHLAAGAAPPIPPGAFLAEDLTQRLKEKMAEAYGGDMSRVPAAKIHLSNGSLDEFIDFYEQRGYRVQRITVQVQRILQPVLRDRPELAGKIRLEDYADQVIHQAMVEGTGVSAADRYIDPDSYQVVDRLFVTEMPTK